MQIVGHFLEHSFPCNFHQLSLRIQFLANSAPPDQIVTYEMETLVLCVGYDIRTESGYDEMMHDLQKYIGLNYLKAVHMNDSRG